MPPSQSDRAPVCPEGWDPVCGPVRSVPTVRLAFDDGRDQPPTGRYLEDGCVTVGNRVMAYWQQFGHLLGNGTIVGFERHRESGWIKVVIDYDYADSYDVERSHDGFVRWDYDRTILCPGRYADETQEESVARHRAYLREQRAAA